MKVLGLCGGSGSGKGTVCKCFNEFGIECIDTDAIYHAIISEDSECTLELVKRFGEKIYANPGIDRRELSNIVFNSREDLLDLNKITHKHVLGEVRRIISQIKKIGVAKGIVVDAPMLFESGFDAECDCTLGIIADEIIRLDRIISRDGISRDQAIKRIRSQTTNEELTKKCTYTLANDSSINNLRDSVREITKIIFN